jgi:butyryl-CoA dehydrogenase
MDFKLNEQQLMVQKMVRDFAAREVEPIANEIDENSRFPMENYRKMGQLGMLGVTVPPIYGGAGADYITYMIVIEELSKICASHGGIVAAINSLVCWPLLEYGTEDQKMKFLKPICQGKEAGAFALTEPEAGSDAIKQQTTAVDMGDHYIINGVKHFISGGDVADTIIIIAKVCRPGRRRGHIGAFLVRSDMPGFSVGTKENKMGIRASGTAELVLEDVKVPKENVLGDIKDGFRIAMATLDTGRISIGAQALGIAQGCLDQAIEYSQQRRQFNQTISKFQAIQWKIADMATRVEASRLLVYRAAQTKQEGGDIGKISAMAKLYASETSTWAAYHSLQIHGGYGYMKDYPIERMYRDAKITEIYEGTSEIQRLVIAASLLK